MTMLEAALLSQTAQSRHVRALARRRLYAQILSAPAYDALLTQAGKLGA
jgi:hypothetical protein